MVADCFKVPTNLILDADENKSTLEHHHIECTKFGILWSRLINIPTRVIRS